MSERIDVRAALGRMSIRASFGRLRDNDISPQQMSEENQADLRAIAAVDELVEAAKLALDGLNVAAGQESEAFLGFVFAGDCLRAALARIAPNELHDKAAELRGRGE